MLMKRVVALGAVATLAMLVGLGVLSSRVAAQPPVTITLNPAITYQTMGGWGADSSFMRDLNFVSQDTLNQITEEAVNDLGLTFLRCCFGRLTEPFNDNSDPRSIDGSGFTDFAAVDHDVALGLGLFKQRVEANGETPTFLLNKDWEDTAPSWMNAAEFAENTAAMIIYLRDRHGINVTFTTIDNEPSNFDPYTPSLQQSMIKVMGPRCKRSGSTPRLRSQRGSRRRVRGTTWTS
jgi:hypothetical protein